MSRHDKLIERFRQNPKNVRFEEIDKVLRALGFTSRQSGSHVVFTRDKSRITVPIKKPFVKPIYVKQLLELLDELEEWYLLYWLISPFTKMLSLPPSWCSLYLLNCVFRVVCVKGAVVGGFAVTSRSVNEYLALPYTIEVFRDDSDGEVGYVARVVELPGCFTQADSFEELGEMIQDAMRAWIETAMEDGQPIPEPRSVNDYSGKFVVRLPKSLHREMAQLADRDGVSLNSLVNVALSRFTGLDSETQKI
jgi:antitoxin HicB